MGDAPPAETELDRTDRLNQTLEDLHASFQEMVQGFNDRIVTLRQEMISPVAAIDSVSTTDVSTVWPDRPGLLAPNRGAGFTMPRDLHVAAITQDHPSASTEPSPPRLFDLDDASASTSTPPVTYAEVTAARNARRREILTPAPTLSTLPHHVESLATAPGRLQSILPTSHHVESLATAPGRLPSILPTSSLPNLPRHATPSTTPPKEISYDITYDTSDVISSESATSCDIIWAYKIASI